jgi:hypothetical protein
MTDADGLGTGTHMSAYLSWQNAEHSRHFETYGGQKIPRALRMGIPDTIVEYNEWLESVFVAKPDAVTVRVKTLMGFIMGFKRDHPLHDPKTNRFIAAGRNAHQEYNMFQVGGSRSCAALVCVCVC